MDCVVGNSGFRRATRVNGDNVKAKIEEYEDIDEDIDDDDTDGAVKERVRHGLTDPGRTIFAAAHKRGTMEAQKYGLVHVEWRISTELADYDSQFEFLVDALLKLGSSIATRVPGSTGLAPVTSEALTDMRSIALRGTVGPVATRAQSRIGVDGPVELHRREVARIEALGKKMLADGASRAAVEAHVRPLYRAASRAMEAAFEELEAAAAKK